MSILHGESYKPRNGFTRWLEKRLPIIGLIYPAFVTFPTPRNLNYAYTFGGILLVCLMIQIISGIVLSMHYTPHVDYAFESIEHIMRDVNYGWLIRYMHANGASMFFLAVYIHIFRGLYYGSYKEPRELLWIIGVMLYLMMMATAFLGYLLPWGQMSFWGATVITNFFSAIPFVGDAIVEWLRGGFSIDNATLNRFFSLHYLLPFMIVGVVVLHIWGLHVVGNSNPTGVELQKKEETVPFHPYYTLKDGFALVLFLMLFALFLFYMPNVLGHTDNYIKADSLVTPAHIVPEWYFLPFYAILRAVPDKLLGVLIMFASIGVLFILPWLDTSPVRSAAFRPLYRQFFWIFVFVCLGLGYMGAMPPEGLYLTMSRLLTVYYFFHFLFVLPVLGFFETPRPLPASIMPSVLDTEGKGDVDEGA
ncbi:MAG: cytochrome b N-terminal domain-containing protein [Alphaproteobacteria bacterium]|nr:cytochrome b N-terminal domain-containing protein [Alphaproteobacteria bacterium]